jgi:hypothetical protein
MKDKQCNACGKILPLARFSPDRRAAGGVRGKCRQCTAEAAKWARTQRREVPDEKPCSSCERVLPASHYTRDGSYTTGLSSWCRDCREIKYYGRYRDTRPTHKDRRK